MEIQTFLGAAIVIEGLISWASTLFIDKKVQWKVIVSLLFGILFAVDLNLNLFQLVGFNEQYPVIGLILTGVVISRGSNYVFELYDRLVNWKEGK